MASPLARYASRRFASHLSAAKREAQRPRLKRALLAVPAALAGGAAAAAVRLASPSQQLHAEAAASPAADDDSPSQSPSPSARRKPIYEDDDEPAATAPRPSPPCAAPAPPSAPSPTPTDRLAGHIGQVRLAAYARASAAERATDALLARAFAAERTAASTLAGLAPSRASGETVLPGAAYALVAAMGASVAVRGRGALARGAAPLLAGAVVARTLLPVTCANVGQLVWRAEQAVPAVADAHERAQARVERFVATAVEHSKMGGGMLEDGIGKVRRTIEGWVSKGR